MTPYALVIKTMREVANGDGEFSYNAYLVKVSTPAIAVSNLRVAINERLIKHHPLKKGWYIIL